jgi:Mrp family chromosome partitioning ATPase
MSKFSFTASHAVLRHAGLPLLGLFVGLVGAQAVTELTPPTFEATSSMVVTTEGVNGRANEGLAGLTLAQSLAPTVARLAESREVALDTATTLGLPPRLVVGHIDSTFEPGVQIISVHATARSGTQAAAIANAAIGAVSRQLALLRTGASDTITTRLLDRASPPSRPTNPKPPLNAAFGGLAGLLAGLGLSRMRGRLDDRLRGLSQIEAQLGLPVLTVLPRLPLRFAYRHARRLFSRNDVADAINAAVAALTVLTTSQPRRRLLITSSHDDDSKALVAALLALGFAHHHDRVTLVEGQLRRPAISGHFPEAAGRTLQQVLADGHVPEPSTGHETITVLHGDPNGCTLGSASIYGEPLGALLRTLADRDDTVIVHAPPVLAGADLAALARHVDGVVLVVRTGVTRKALARRAALLVQRLGPPLVGLIAVGTAGERFPWAFAPPDFSASRSAEPPLRPTGQYPQTPSVPGGRKPEEASQSKEFA